MKAIGGYFELEVVGGPGYYPDLLHLNTGRNCLEYLLRAGNFKKIYLPRFSCKVLLEPIKKLNIEFEYYRVDQNLNPVLDFSPKKDEVVLYINYFGIKDAVLEQLSHQIENLIVDNSQAFFSDKTSALGTFYSARKFFGVPDGAYLSSNLVLEEELKMDYSWDRMSHLLKRLELGAESGYSDFQENSLKLSEQPILQMSELSKSLLSHIDYSEVKQIREENFRYLHQQLSGVNQFDFSDLLVNGPMVYPLYVENENVRKELLQNKIFTACYWPNVLEECPADSLDYKLAKYILPLPVDQRYNREDMERICKVLLAVL
ncbi:hypothetical protein [Labilibaculum manganireducens]|uniref:DegT/DnrJ/EryC1/StrS aminotransferase n=1 Tax=Labilibaculum manganireducens TaxID=1940525 RepID=A0A2N3ICE7_9BACT|nr:hypothetical protein [Labilibaculum manganireducens]PKQ67955.1 hypothetical protein BZG01_06210 [Labilibaculum manganireducens]